MERILFILTSHGEMAKGGRATGVHLAEVAHPYEVLHTAGFDVDFVSPLGGRVPFDLVDFDDAITEKWLHNNQFRAKIDSTMRPEQVVPSQYRAIYYAGGHGALHDLPDSEKIGLIAGKIYEAGGIVASVCHGAAGLLAIKMDGGEPLIKDLELTGFTNEEEVAIGCLDKVPFLLEDRLIEEGALFSKANPFQKHVVVSRRVVTGQNPASARAVGEEVRKLISKTKSAFVNVEESTIAP